MAPIVIDLSVSDGEEEPSNVPPAAHGAHPCETPAAHRLPIEAAVKPTFKTDYSTMEGIRPAGPKAVAPLGPVAMRHESLAAAAVPSPSAAAAASKPADGHKGPSTATPAHPKRRLCSWGDGGPSSGSKSQTRTLLLTAVAGAPAAGALAVGAPAAATAEALGSRRGGVYINRSKLREVFGGDGPQLPMEVMLRVRVDGVMVPEGSRR